MSDTIIFRTVCMYCDVTLSEKPLPDPTPDQIAMATDGVITSHGICKKCLERAERDMGLAPISDALTRAINNVVRVCYQHRAQRLRGAA